MDKENIECIRYKKEFDGKTYPIHPLPDNLMDIINAGGLVKAMQKRNGII